MAHPSGDGCYGRPMLHHVVTFDLKPDAPADQVEQIAAALDALAGSLPEVRSLVPDGLMLLFNAELVGGTTA